MITAFAVSGGFEWQLWEWDAVSNAAIFEPSTFVFPIHKIIVSRGYQ